MITGYVVNYVIIFEAMQLNAYYKLKNIKMNKSF